MKKFITILSIIVLIMLCFSNYVLADSITGSMKNKWNKENQDTRIMKTMGGKILNIVQIVGVAVAVIMLSVLGIKYMFASTNDKANIKEKLMAYVTKFDLELGGFGNGREDDFLEIVADLFIHEYKEYVGNDFVEKCRFLMHETDEGNKYCYLKYEKKFDDLSESERDTVMKKVINECISQMQRV